jgi:methionyl-tRNA formyltransferase
MAHPAKLAFFGTDAFSDTALRALIDHGYRVEVVITKPDSYAGRKRVLTAPAVKITAESHNIPVMQPTRAVELLDTLKSHCEAGIVVSYGKILPQAVLDLFPRGLVNIHASLLPLYRGASPIEAALLNGDEVTGISLMKLDAGMDTGPVYAQAEYIIEPTDTAATLYPKLAEIGADILIRELDDILDGTLTPTPQDDSAASHVGIIKKSDGLIDWNKPTQDIERQIRAYLIWPGSKTVIAGTEVTITSASSSEASGAPGTLFKTDSGELAVYCGEGSLVINTLIPAGKRQMTGKEFLAGHPLA